MQPGGHWTIREQVNVEWKRHPRTDVLGRPQGDHGDVAGFGGRQRQREQGNAACRQPVGSRRQIAARRAPVRDQQQAWYRRRVDQPCAETDRQGDIGVGTSGRGLESSQARGGPRRAVALERCAWRRRDFFGGGREAEDARGRIPAVGGGAFEVRDGFARHGEGPFGHAVGNVDEDHRGHGIDEPAPRRTGQCDGEPGHHERAQRGLQRELPA